jgi:hypothetical protein
VKDKPTQPRIKKPKLAPGPTDRVVRKSTHQRTLMTREEEVEREKKVMCAKHRNKQNTKPNSLSYNSQENVTESANGEFQHKKRC